jgi:hypothetical protein
VSSNPHVHRFAAAGHHKNNLPHDGTFQLAMRFITAEGLHTPEIMKKNEIAMTTDSPMGADKSSALRTHFTTCKSSTAELV